MTTENKMCYEILTSVVIKGHWRSKALHFEMLCMYNHMTLRNNKGYLSLTTEVNGGHCRSKLRSPCRLQITTTVRAAIFCMYTLMISIDM